MQVLLVVALSVSALSAAGAVANEATHGGVAQWMGLGHHHMADFGGYHCASHSDPDHGAQHVQHMHDRSAPRHDACPGGPSMHGGMLHG